MQEPTQDPETTRNPDSAARETYDKPVNAARLARQANGGAKVDEEAPSGSEDGAEGDAPGVQTPQFGIPVRKLRQSAVSEVPGGLDGTAVITLDQFCDPVERDLRTASFFFQGRYLISHIPTRRP